MPHNFKVGDRVRNGVCAATVIRLIADDALEVRYDGDRDLTVQAAAYFHRIYDLRSAPIGTLAPAIMGGAWLKTDGGWQWNGHCRCPGSTFPRPGGDWNGELILPSATDHRTLT